MRFNAKIISLCVACLIVTVSCTAVLATPTVTLSWYKNNGYGLGNDIGGEWTITAQVSSDVNRVEFYLDNQLQQNISSAQFKWAFNTADYTVGSHTIKVVVYNASGETATAQADRNFVEYSTDLVGVIIGVVIAVIAISLVVALYWVRKRKRTNKETKFSLFAPHSPMRQHPAASHPSRTR